MIRRIAVMVCLGAALAAPRAMAQNPQPAPPGQVPAPVAPPNSASPPPEKIVPGGPDAPDGDGGSLSDKLSQQHGTLQPPRDADRGMVVQPPAQSQGTMPVIPPSAPAK